MNLTWKPQHNEGVPEVKRLACMGVMLEALEKNQRYGYRSGGASLIDVTSRVASLNDDLVEERVGVIDVHMSLRARPCAAGYHRMSSGRRQILRNARFRREKPLQSYEATHALSFDFFRRGEPQEDLIAGSSTVFSVEYHLLEPQDASTSLRNDSVLPYRLASFPPHTVATCSRT